ncbi:MAG TPA: hypothetical protein VNV37_10860 [Solirubrobacteraceae bacterium]|jgi:hypothetical protein|nr:hypothetical protein [Solirubrobacteraceae bacterium]
MTRLLRAAALTLALSVGAALSPAAGAVPSEPPKPPANDEVASAQAIHALPASIEGTTVGATTVPGEAQSGCVPDTVSSVWYSLHTGAAAQRVAVELAAGGKLDGTIDVYKAVRSQLLPVACQGTEEEGKASLSFKAQKNTEYEIRVAALANSQLASFTLNVFQPTPAIAPPGPRLHSAGASGEVDRIQNSNAAYSLVLHAGVSYLINLVNETRGGCVNGALFAPGTSSFEGTSARFRVNCGGYRLFTPGQGKGGIYSYEVTPDPERKGEQRFHLQVTVANGTQITPGQELGNYGRSSGRLEGAGIQVLRLYRVDVTSHSNLTLRLSAPASAEFNLQLRDQNGNLLACACSGSGSQKLQQQLRKGHYYAVVSARNHTSGDFTLTRESRTITHTKIAFGAEHGVVGRAVAIKIRVAPGAAGPVKVEVQRFDPVFGWQFYRTLEVAVSEGSMSIPFTPPSPGNWRANAAYAGSRVFSPSAVGFTYLFVD